MKKVLITGASGCIGSALAKWFLHKNCIVYNFDIRPPDYDCEYRKVDIREPDQIKPEIAKIGSLDILINNAGIYMANRQADEIQAYDEMMDTNFKGVFLMTALSVGSLKDHASIVNISSGLGMIADPDSSIYCSSKSAILMYTKCMALKLADRKIRVNAVLPGPIHSPLMEKAFAGEQEMSGYVRLNPQKRLGQPEEVVRVVDFLCDPKSSFITGASYTVDGGESVNSPFNFL